MDRLRNKHSTESRSPDHERWESHSSSPSPIKQKGKDKSSGSRMKKLRRRLSQSFGRLSLSKDELSKSKQNTPEHTNGHHLLCGTSSDDLDSPPITFDLGGYPYKPTTAYYHPTQSHTALPHTVTHLPMTSSMDDRLLLGGYHPPKPHHTGYVNVYSVGGPPTEMSQSYHVGQCRPTRGHGEPLYIVDKSLSQKGSKKASHARHSQQKYSQSDAVKQTTASYGGEKFTSPSHVLKCNSYYAGSHGNLPSTYSNQSVTYNNAPGNYVKQPSIQGNVPSNYVKQPGSQGNVPSNSSKESGYYSNRPSYHESMLGGGELSTGGINPDAYHLNPSHGNNRTVGSPEHWLNGNGTNHMAMGACLPHPVVEQLRRSPVKRHLSTGDMLENTQSPDQVKLRPQRLRHRRPKSEGNLIVEGYISKRASSFGFNSDYGKAENYEKLEQLGEGSYATVFKGKSLLTGQVVALKEIRLQQEEGTPFTAIREASLLKGLKHANIVTLHDIIHTKDSLTFVFEFVHSDLGQYLEKHPGGLNPRNVKLFLFQLLRGLMFCHDRKILHRDLKPQNLLISEGGELKLADFGLARAKSIPSHSYSHEVVTLWYRPPDVLLGSTQYSCSLDMWGVGCIFTEMISGQATFPGMKDAYDQLDKIFKVLGTPNDNNWDGVSEFKHYKPTKFGMYASQRLALAIPKLAHIPYAEHLAEGLLQLCPSDRINAYSAIHHQYFADLPSAVYDLQETMSIFRLPSIRLAAEMDQLLRTTIRTNPRLGTRETTFHP